MQFLLLLLFSTLSYGTSVEVVDYSFTTPSSAPSCRLLLHRKKEREKVLREFGNIEGDAHLSNTLLMNKYFYEIHHWVDESVEVYLQVRLKPALLEQIKILGHGNFIFKIHGRGITWHSRLDQLPSGMRIYFHPDQNLVDITYPIYLSELCFGEPSPPELELMRAH